MARVMALAPKSSTSKSPLFPSSGHQDELFSLSPLSLSEEHRPELFPGETILSSVQCTFLFPGALALPGIPGTLLITSFRLRFEPHTSSLRSIGAFHRLLDTAIRGIPRAAVARLSYPQATVAASRSLNAFSSGTGTDVIPSKIVVKFKDLRSWMLGGDVTTLLPTLTRYAYVDSPLNLFAFTSMPPSPEDLAGHVLYHLYDDFARMGVVLGDPSCPYRVTTLNATFTLCPTYPRELVVPAGVTDADVTAVASFRSKGRFPICSYVHASNGAALWRCAQPKRGILHAQNASDEHYLVEIAHAASSAKSGTRNRKIWIADCRPELNARVNNLTGGGTESGNLPHARVSFLNIGNIHAMRESLEAVRSLGELLASSSSTESIDLVWGSRVEETKWLLHVRRVLSGALQVARALETLATTVLVHCSDGWDRTAQLCGLAQVLVDPQYRTRRGFLAVIEKEWVRAGHKFQARVGPGKAEDDDEEQAPVFLQFLDCVWQVLRLFPTSFEFNERLLETIADATFSGQYGTFLGNCERERSVWQVRERTPSLYAVVLDDEHFVNPFYRPQSSAALVPDPSIVLRHVTLWSSYYFRGAPMPPCLGGNPTPPLYARDDVDHVATNAQEDLELAMKAALRRIQCLEDQVHSSRPKATTTTTTAGLTIVQSFTEAKTWTCTICTKTNAADVLQCIVCGRAPR
ncbi:hypothetical protein PsorP6_001103 [Peronosclerospora sorghi]|uniref:Uncharacterized protein n=1 Tax=Peronosclerospora sorghi TaxID=230839 RepID=A0ACC0WTK0_9STRA|nr:hypothetical protein PsorP6_001103 [Peronosclerospora sorghi]